MDNTKIAKAVGSLCKQTEDKAIVAVWRRCFSVADGLGVVEADFLAIEEPLQISLEWHDLTSGELLLREWSMTMRTPGDDVNLVSGLLLSQQVIDDLTQIVAIRCLDDGVSYANNQLVVSLALGVEPQWDSLARNYISQSSCGICGVTSMRALALKHEVKLDAAKQWLDPLQLIDYPKMLADNQPLFQQAGSVHGAGYVVAGKLVAVAEDIGRHNALDKLLGRILSENLWHRHGVLVLSGRISFELMQKALLGRIAVIVAVGAPSKLALSMAQQFDITLIGFTRQHKFNIYNGQDRLILK